MKKISLTILTLALGFGAMAQSLDRSKRPEAGPAPEIKLGKSESFTLPNGLKVFVVENHKLPTFSASIQLDIKPELEGEMAGYREMMSELLLSGTKTRSKDQLNQEIDFLGARISASDEGMYASGLTKHQDKIFELMADILMNANITQEELEKVKTLMRSGLEAEENEPDAMLQKVSAVLNYGKRHPYGEVATKESIDKISLDRVKQYYTTYFRPNVAYMAIVGDVTVAQIKPVIEKYFGNWKKATVPVAQYSNPVAPSTRQVAFVPREAAVQSVINVTYPLDLKPGAADAIKARVANSILGGGSNGRLFLNLREKHGWTYGSYSSISQDHLKGSFTAYAKGRNAVTDSSVTEMIAEMNKMRNEKVGSEELKNHLTNLSGSFAIALENPATVAQYAINIERYNMPKDYYQNYLKNLAAVTADDIQSVARKYINPEKAHIVVVGSKDEVAESLKRFDSDGTIDFYDTYGNSVKPATTAAAPANLTADDVMKKYIQAIGGADAVRAVKDIRTESKGSINMGGQALELTITEMKKAPAKMKMTIEGMGMVLQKMVVNGDKGYNEAQGQRQDLEGDELKEAQQQADIYADLNPEKYGIKRTLKGMEQVNGTDVYVLEAVDANGKKSSEYYDTNTGLLIRTSRSLETPQGALSQVSEYSDYREVEGGKGFKIPFKVKQTVGPQAISAEVQTVEVNKGIADTEFE